MNKKVNKLIFLPSNQQHTNHKQAMPVAVSQSNFCKSKTKYINSIRTVVIFQRHYPYIAEKVTPMASTLGSAGASVQVTQANTPRENQSGGRRKAEPRSSSYSSDKRPPSHAQQPSTISGSNWGSCQKQTTKSRRIRPVRASICPTCRSGLHTKGDAERKVTTTTEGTGAHGERPICRGEGCGRLEGLQSRLTKPIKAVNKLNVQLLPCVVICQTL